VYAWPAGEPQPVRIADGTGLAISPDGKKALVVARDARLRISIVPTGAGQPQALDIGPVDFLTWAGWLPDGRLVIQSGRNGASATVSIISKTGGTPVDLLPSGMRLGGAGQKISPDGSLIAAHDKESRLTLCTIAAPAVCRPMPGAEAGDSVAGWGADGRSVVIFKRDANTVSVARLDITTGRRTATTTIRPIEAALSGIGDVMAATDGAIAYSYARDASQLYVIKGLK
jgi:DNA-binding beta-propeller fold protein YncE